MSFQPPPPIYPLTANLAGDHTVLAQELLKGGATWIQIRDKSQLPDRELLRQLEEIQRTACRFGASIVVNDRADLALATGAAGVHLGQQDLPPARARDLLGQDRIVGLSTHNLEQFKDACRQPVDYVAVGPIFETGTKPGTSSPLGLEFLRQIRQLTDRPLVAIGGINLDRAREVWSLGIESVAVVSDIVQHESPRQRLSQYLELARGLSPRSITRTRS